MQHVSMTQEGLNYQLLSLKSNRLLHHVHVLSVEAVDAEEVISDSKVILNYHRLVWILQSNKARQDIHS